MAKREWNEAEIKSRAHNLELLKDRSKFNTEKKLIILTLKKTYFSNWRNFREHFPNIGLKRRLVSFGTA
ncbi:hypothetical protein BpHYR1_050947 [Brachionus plicatilis]|uniref:Uncharacterized protein n=1 Tax=Brachionus plicatilis TaxID=10195 RepID=A0A3M7QTR5_BRAPC|nr:hypothetical protein BpHYR1_050947 [Brachionus plicatilis]